MIKHFAHNYTQAHSLPRRWSGGSFGRYLDLAHYHRGLKLQITDTIKKLVLCMTPSYNNYYSSHEELIRNNY